MSRAQKNEIAPSQVSSWKKELEERTTELSERKHGVNEIAGREEKRAGARASQAETRQHQTPPNTTR